MQGYTGNMGKGEKIVGIVVRVVRQGIQFLQDKRDAVWIRGKVILFGNLASYCSPAEFAPAFDPALGNIRCASSWSMALVSLQARKPKARSRA